MTNNILEANIADMKPKVYYDFTPLTALDLLILTSASASPHMAVLFTLCYWTGIEIRYLLEMTYSDLNSISHGTFSISHTNGIVSGMPLSIGLQQILTPYIGKGKENDFVFKHEDGSAWTSTYVDGAIEELSRNTGIIFTAETLLKSYYANIVFSMIPPTKYNKREKALKQTLPK